MDDRAHMQANRTRLSTRSCEGLLGLCQGLLADHVLNEPEVRFLDLWLRDHSEISEVWPGNVIFSCVREILHDEVFSEEKLQCLTELLISVLGATWKETGATSGLSTKLPIQSDAQIFFVDRTFCFSGTFAAGKRSVCESLVGERGGIVKSDITRELDFLVVGKFDSPDWLNTSFGRKILKAVRYQEEGCKVQIVSEKCWSEAIDLV